MIEAYKYLNGSYDVDCSKMMPLHESNGMRTRGHNLKLEKRECRGRTRSNFFGYRIVNVWNSLPEEVVSAPSVNCLKGRFDRYSGDRKYAMEWGPDVCGRMLTQTGQGE